MSEELRFNVQRMIDNGVPEQEIGAFIQRHSSQVPSVPQPQQAPPQEMSWGDVGSQAIKSAPSSALQFAKDITAPIHSPIDTFQGLKSLAKGVYQKFTPEVQADEASVDALTQHFANRYGSVEGFKKAMASDPVSVLGDASVLMSGGGSLLAKVGQAGKLGKAGSILKKAGDFVDPVNLAIKQPASTATKLMTSPEGLKSLYMESMKPSKKSLAKGGDERMWQTAQKYDLPVATGAAEKAEDLINVRADKVTDIIKEGAEAGETIDKYLVGGSALEDLYTDIASGSINKKRDTGQVMKVLDNFLDSADDAIPVDQAQKMKRTIQKRHAEREKARKERKPTQEAEVAIGRDLVKQLEAKFPDLKYLNAEQSELITLLNELNDATGRIQKHNIFGLSDFIAGAGAANISGGLSVPVSIATKVFNAPKFKSKLALALMKARKAKKTMATDTAALSQAYYQAGKGTKIVTDQNDKIKSVEVQ